MRPAMRWNRVEREETPKEGRKERTAGRRTGFCDEKEQGIERKRERVGQSVSYSDQYLLLKAKDSGKDDNRMRRPN